MPMLKRFAKRVIKRMTAMMPATVSDTIFEQIREDRGPWSIVSEVAPLCGVTALQVAGEYGVIQSAVNDMLLPIYARTGRWAGRTNGLLRSFYGGRDGYYIDVGANIGLTTIPIAQNPHVSCLAIEPHPLNYTNLTANVARNCPHGNVELRQVAIFSSHETLRFEVSPVNSGDHRIRRSDDPGRLGEGKWPTIDITAAPLDAMATTAGAPLAVKIDVQGSEPFVFAGGKRTLTAAGLIILEWWPYAMARMGSDPQVVTSFLRDHFKRLTIAEGEEGAVATPEAADVVVEKLLEMAHRDKDNPRRYVDVIAER